MKLTQGTFALAITVAGSLALGGCFGPFKKKSSSGGGSGGSTEEKEAEEEGKGKTTKTAAETPSTPPAASTPPPPGAKDGYGCLQGVVSDGFTGQPVAYDATKMFVLIRGTKIAATKVDGIDGQYFICDIPVENTYPVYAFLDGYMPFESAVTIVSTRAKRVAAGGQDVVDEVKIPDPVVVQDIRLFPLGNTTRDLRVRAVHNGTPVKDAIVDVESMAAGSSGTFGFDGVFANTATGNRVLPMRATTGDDGYATFAASKLSLGAAYKVTVHPPIGKDLVAAAHANIVLGVSGALPDDFNTYDLNVILTDGTMPLKVISCSTLFQNYAADGAIKIMFNRAVSIVDQDNLDGAAALTAAVVGANSDPLALVTAVAANNIAENVSFGVAGNVLTLGPKFVNNDTVKPLEAADPSSTLNAKNKNATITWTYGNVKLKVAGDEDQNKVTLSSFVTSSGAGGTFACNNVVRFFPEID